MSTRIKKSDLARDALYEKVNTIADELDNSKVSKTGDKMNGTLTNNGVFVSQFDAVNFIARSKTLVKGTTPTDSDNYVGYDWQDKNGQRLVYLGVSYHKSGLKRLELQKIDSNLSEFYIPFRVNFQNSEVFFTNLPYKPQKDFYGAHYTIIGTNAAINFRGASTTTGRIKAEMMLTDKSQTKETYHSISIDRDIDNQITTTHCPIPADNSNSDAIATTNWAGGLKRDNTWNGENTFQKSPKIYINGNARYKSVCTGYTKGTAPTTVQFGGISTMDRNGVEVATFYSTIDTNNTIKSALAVRQPTASGKEAKEIAIYCDKNGVFHSYAPQCSTNNSIDTIVEHGQWYIKYGSGLLIQWGVIYDLNANTRTITLQTPFSNPWYYANVITSYGAATVNDPPSLIDTRFNIYRKEKTYFKVQGNNTKVNVDWFAVGYWKEFVL